MAELKTLDKVPVELWENVVRFLDRRSAGRLLRCSRFFSFAVQRALDRHSERFWPVKVVKFKERVATQRTLDLKTNEVID